MAAPNRAADVDYVNRAHPNLLQSNTHEDDAKFCQHFIERCGRVHGERWGHLTKRPGENGFTFPDGQRVSHDVVVHYDSQWLVDIIGASANHPQPGSPTFIQLGPQGVDRPWNEYIDMCGRFASSHCIPMIIVPDEDGGNPAPPQGIPIIITAFPALAAIKKFRSELVDALAWEYASLWPDGARVFGHVMGGPWVETLPDGRPGAAVNKDWPDYRDVLKGLEDVFRFYDMNQNMMTFFGGPVPLQQGKDFITRMRDWLDPNVWKFYEICNEWKVNGWRADDVKALCDHFNYVFGPNKLIATSSPHMTHNAEGSTGPAEIRASFDEIYGGVHTSWCTVHRSREPSSPWYDMRNITPLYPKPMGDTEGPGPGASGVGPEASDPVVLTRSYMHDKEAGCLVYDRHVGYWVFMGHIDDAAWGNKHPWQHPSEHPTLESINRSLREARNRDGSGSGGGGGGGEEPMIPYDETKSIEFGLACNDVYAESGAAFDAGMVSVHSSRAAWDHYVGGLAWEASKRKHINNFRAEYGLPPI